MIDQRKNHVRTDDWDRWIAASGRPLQIGQWVRVCPANDISRRPWSGAYIVTSLNLDPRTGRLRVQVTDLEGNRYGLLGIEDLEEARR